MKTSRITVTKSVLFALAVASAAAACGGSELQEPEEGNAYLSIVGDRNVFVDFGVQQRLQVRYHNDADEPLAGQVDFSIVGDARGATLSSPTGVTNSQGIVEINLVAGNSEASFRIQATAPYAQPVEWTIAVNEGAQPLPPLDPEGEYRLDSTFDIAANLPGDAGEVINTFIEMTDDPYDPATYIIDRALEEIDNSILEGAVNLTRPALDGIVNDKILESSPDLVNELIELGDQLGQVARKFGTVSELKVAKSSGPERSVTQAVHTMTGFQFKVNGTSYEYTMNELGADEPVVQNVSINVSQTNKVTVGEHDMPLKYGAFLALALNEVIVPEIDPFSYSLADLFANNVDCAAVGQSIADFVEYGTPGLYEGACDLALSAAAGVIIDQLANIDVHAPVTMKITGEAKASDTNSDKKIDTLSAGKWNGTIDFDGSADQLADGAAFIGARMR